MGYEERRKRLKKAIDRNRTPLTEIVYQIEQETGERQSYEYIRGVLNGKPGQTSSPVLDKVERQLDQLGISVPEN